jgi:hypothetical protein
MRGERIQGRFTIDSERASIISGTTKELVYTVGQSIDWYYYDPALSSIDPTYDVGANTGGRIFDGPHTVPVVQAALFQGVSMQGDRGLYNTDILRVTVNMDVIEQNTPISGSSLPKASKIQNLTNNPDEFLRDRIVFRNEVFTPDQIQPKGIIKGKYTLVTIDCVQVNAEELVNDPQFTTFAGYSAFTDDGDVL